MSQSSTTTAPQGEGPAAVLEPGSHIERVAACLQRAAAYLLSLQKPDGYWCAELEGDSILQSEYILMMWILGLEKDPRLPRIAKYLRMQQRPDGGWAQYPGGTVGGGVYDHSATVKAYFALKLMGDSITAAHMVKARELILKHGGAPYANTFSKFYLAALGQISYDAVPIIPPQIIFLPKWSYFHMDNIAAWTRTMIAPLAVVTMHRPVRQLPPEMGIDELYPDPKTRHRLTFTGFSQSKAWTTLFLKLDLLMKVLDSYRVIPLRERAIERMIEWLEHRCEGADGPGAIFPPLVYLLIVLIKCKGRPVDDPLAKRIFAHLDNFMIYGLGSEARNGHREPEGEDDTIRLQPCESVIWDTGIAAYALTNAGLDHSDPRLRRCSDWLVTKECRHRGDWLNNIREPVEPSGWYFEYNNCWYPDVDDTVMVAMALKRIGHDQGIAAAKRALAMVFAMQNDDGGWAAFDKTNHRQILEYIPFADHNAMQDPSCPDITGRTFECLGNMGIKADHPCVGIAMAHLQRTQQPEGCWFGRWGVNYIYGTYQVLVGLKAIGADMHQPWIRKAADWLRSVQKEDGSFGESPDSYEDRRLMGKGHSTASQTAWGTMGMMAVYGHEDSGVARGVEWLCATQLGRTITGSLGCVGVAGEPGGWHEPWFTGTGFPKVFYLRYHLYKIYFPVMCLGRWLGAQGKLPKIA